MIKVIWDNSDVLYDDFQSLSLIGKGKVLLHIYYCCTTCGSKNPYVDTAEELTYGQFLKREGVNEELKKAFLLVK